MKKLQLAFAALVLVSTISIAQPTAKQDARQGRHQSKDKMQELNLTEDQKAQMKIANDEFRAQMKSIKSDEKQTVKQQRDKIAALEQTHKTKLDNLLTAEQKTKMGEWKGTAKQHHGELNDRGIEKMKQDLNLTEAQANELKTNQAALKSKMDAIQNNTSLDATAKRQQMSALKAERKAMMDKVLTPEQKQKFQGMHKEHRGDKKMQKVKRTKVATV